MQIGQKLKIKKFKWDDTVVSGFANHCSAKFSQRRSLHDLCIQNVQQSSHGSCGNVLVRFLEEAECDLRVEAFVVPGEPRNLYGNSQTFAGTGR